MPYVRIGATTGFGVPVPADVQARSIQAARPRLGDMLSALQDISDGKLKLLSSADPTLVGQMCGGAPCQNITSPTPWDGSNVVVWPAADYNDLANAWSVGNGYVGTTGAFALDLVNVATAIAATQRLISAIDVKMRFSGLNIKESSSSFPWWVLLLGVGAVGVAVATNKPSKKARKKRTSARRRRR